MKPKFLSFIVLLFLSSVFFCPGCSSPSSPGPSAPRWDQKILLGAYYYLWYPGNWGEGYLNGRLTPPQWPALGQYESSDLKTIEQHIAWSSQYGIHFWAVSWWPDQPQLDGILREKILKAKNTEDIKFCIFYETAGLGLVDDRITFTSDKTKKMISDFKYLAQTYFSHPSYLKINGRPVVVIYLTRTFDGQYPEAISGLRKSLKELGFDPFLVGDEIFWYVIRTAPLSPSPNPNRDRIRLFDGITAYNMYNWAKPKQMGYGNASTFLSDVHDLYGQYKSALGKEGSLIPSIIPGYNDRGVRLSDKHPAIPRQFAPGAEEGSFFKEALKRTVLPFIDPHIPMALITSFNEWNEGTQIEPTVESNPTRQDRSPSKTEYTQGYAYGGYGEKYLSILQDTFVAIRGRIVDDRRGSPLTRVTIKAFKGKELMAVALTDSQGFFNLSRFNLLPGVYDIQANLSANEEIRHKVTVEEKKSAILNLHVKKK